MPGEIICIIGPDGTGKSTQARMLMDTLQSRGIECRYRWLRFHHFLSLPVLGLARLMGLSGTRVLDDGTRIGYHSFSRSRLVSALYPVLLFADTLGYYLAFVALPSRITGTTFVCDRFIHDTIIDLMISVGTDAFERLPMKKYFFGMIPGENLKVFLLNADDSVLIKRRNDIKHDAALSIRIKLYNEAAQICDIKRIDASLPIEEIHGLLRDGVLDE